MTTQLDTPISAAPELDPSAFPPSNAHLIPPLAPQWQALDLREILTRPAAFLSISQSNSLYREGGVQYGEGHAFRGSLDATVKVARAARQAPNFVSFNWIGYTVFRDDYPKSDFDAAQYASWTGHLDASPEQRAWDDALVSDLRDLVEPQDNELYEKALQTAFTGTDLPITLARKKVEVLVLTGTTERMELARCLEAGALGIASKAAGFASVRQFNDTIREVFAVTPRELRRVRGVRDETARGEIPLRLPFRTPFDTNGMLRFLGTRAVAGIETFDGKTYRRTLRLPHGAGVVALSDGGDHIGRRYMGAWVLQCCTTAPTRPNDARRYGAIARHHPDRSRHDHGPGYHHDWW